MAASAPRVSNTSERAEDEHVLVCPATSNVDLKFDSTFGRAFRISDSLRTVFEQHTAFTAVFGTESVPGGRGGVFGRGSAPGARGGNFGKRSVPGGRGRFGRNDSSAAEAKKFPGKIVATSRDSAARRKNALTCTTTEFELASTSKGLVSTIMAAYNTHCDLVLRPDDVWLTILAQFCTYVNKNAEGLRDKIVAHEGQKALKVMSYGSLESADYPGMIRDLLGQIRQNIKSPELADWFRPGFSTTTENDEVCAAATTMATLQAYFTYTMSMMACGIPSVTLMGTVEDWKLLREKVERLLEFEVQGNPEGNVLEVWVGYLRKVCDGFVESVEHPESAQTLEFWDKVFSRIGGGSGVSHITGWVSAFTCFNKDGNFMPGKNRNANREFPLINTKSICHNVVSCPVNIDNTDNDGKEYDGTLIVGQVGMDARRGATGGYPTVRPRNDWCLAVAVKE